MSIQRAYLYDSSVKRKFQLKRTKSKKVPKFKSKITKNLVKNRMTFVISEDLKQRGL